MIIMKEHYILYMEKKQVQRDVNHIKKKKFSTQNHHFPDPVRGCS